jgi:hypothetical protein
MKRRLSIFLTTVVVSLFITEAAYAQGTDPGQTQAVGEIAILLAPLLAVATAIERIIEMIFDWYESAILTVKAIPQNISTYLDWSKKEVKRFEDELISANKSLDAATTDDTKKTASQLIKSAEDKFNDASRRLDDYLKSPVYSANKKKVSMVLGIVLGLVTALVFGVKMFSLLGIPLNDFADRFITGLIVGTGSAPVHSLIGIIQKTRDAIDGARQTWKGRANKDTAELIEILETLKSQSQESTASGGPGLLNKNSAEYERLTSSLLDK